MQRLQQRFANLLMHILKLLLAAKKKCVFDTQILNAPVGVLQWCVFFLLMMLLLCVIVAFLKRDFYFKMIFTDYLGLTVLQLLVLFAFLGIFHIQFDIDY